MNFPKEEALLHEAHERLQVKLNEAFAVGQRVVVKYGRGWMYGTVASLASASLGTVPIRARRGGIHHKHFHDVEFA